MEPSPPVVPRPPVVVESKSSRATKPEEADTELPVDKRLVSPTIGLELNADCCATLRMNRPALDA